MVPTVTSSGRTESGQDGTFEIHLKAVRWITIERISCDGYVRIGGGDEVRRAFSREAGDASYYAPDPKRPELFYLTRKGDIVPLYSNSDDDGVGGRTKIKLNPNGLPTKIDVRTGKLDPNGELEITLIQGDLVAGPYPSRPWRARVGVPGGGVIDARKVRNEASYEQPPVAPAEGSCKLPLA